MEARSAMIATGMRRGRRASRMSWPSFRRARDTGTGTAAARSPIRCDPAGRQYVASYFRQLRMPTFVAQRLPVIRLAHAPIRPPGFQGLGDRNSSLRRPHIRRTAHYIAPGGYRYSSACRSFDRRSGCWPESETQPMHSTTGKVGYFGKRASISDLVHRK